MSNDEVSIEMYCALTDAKFPDYRAIIPKSHTTRLVCDVAKMKQAIKMVMIFAREKSNITNFVISPTGLSISGRSDEYGDGKSVFDGSDVTVEGDGLNISVDGSMFMDALSVIHSPHMVIDMTAPNRPLAIRAMGDDSFLYVLMPMQPK